MIAFVKMVIGYDLLVFYFLHLDIPPTNFDDFIPTIQIHLRRQVHLFTVFLTNRLDKASLIPVSPSD